MSGPARPETLLRDSYLSNHLTDSLAVFFLDNFIPSTNNIRYMWMTPNARATCKNEGVVF